MTGGGVRVEGAINVRLLGLVMALLMAIVLVSIGVRLTIDAPNIAAGTVPDDDFAERYVAHPWVAYGHMLPGVLYLLGAPLQLSRSFRTRHYTLHRRLGRFLVGCAVLSGVLALVLGVGFAWGGAVETLASLVFGGWFLFCLATAVRAIRSKRVAEHRRWMIRAFAVGIGIATIRIWIGVFTGVQIGLLGLADSTFPLTATFGIAFWLGFGMHVAIGEWWLRRTPPLRS